jgi:hypothetical protein
MVTTSNTLFKTKTGLTECRWIAVNNPNYITLIRKDYNVITTSNVGSNTRISVTLTGITQSQFETDFAIGGSVYCSRVDKTYVVVNRSYVGSFGYVFFALDPTIITSFGGGYANCFSRVDYFIEVRYVTIVNSVFVQREEKVIPFVNGELELNISPALRSFLTLKTDGEDLTVINVKDENVSKIAQINYREYFGGQYTVATNLIQPFGIVNNYKNAFEEFGSCLAEYEMEVLSNNKFLTRMVKPYYWSGYPFALGFIFSEKIGSVLVQSLEIEQDINENTIASNGYNVDLSQVGYVNSLALQGAFSGDSVLVRLISGITAGGIINFYAEAYANNYFRGVTIAPSLSIQIISELKRVYIGKCFDSPVYLRWRNSLGYFDFWLFGKRQVKNIAVDKFETFNPLITDIEFQQESESVHTKDKNKVWRLGAYLEMQSVTDIQELFSSPFVQWYNEDNQNWYAVKVRQGTYLELTTDESYAEIEFDIEFPNEYKQQQ